MEHYLNGLKFGLLLQFAVGPVCLLVFNTAQNGGLQPALMLVSAVALVDAFYIFLAFAGVSRLLEKTGAGRALKILSAAVLVLFGLNIILSVFGRGFIPGFAVTAHVGSVFLQGLVLTLSNPLTIVFWGGVLTAEMAEKQYGRRYFPVFAAGLVSATVLFLSSVAALGTALSGFIPLRAANVLNVAVGAVVTFFGVRILIK